MSDSYLVLDKPGHAVIKVKGSRFIAEALPVSSVEDATQKLAVIRKRDYDATHHCSAFRIGSEATQFRYSDDGEPNSSAGLPIYRQIEGRKLTDTLVVVVRYYGGTKLGTGGLVRAYSEAASLALDSASVREVILRTRVQIRFDYQDTSGAMHVISQFDAVIAGTEYGDDTVIQLDLRSTQVAAFADAFIEALSGRGQLEHESA
jgi:uncharacterized YigZ family protein